MRFKIKIIITIMVSFVVIVSMSLFIVNSNSISISSMQPDTVITGSNNSYLITLKGVPSGNGTYQQLITINNYSKYGINGEGSNIAFYDGNNLTDLYAWIQSINITAIQIWVKNYNESSKIDMQVLLKNENLFGVNGYLGEAPQLSSTYAEYGNGKLVFPFYCDFTSISGFNSLFYKAGYCNNNYSVNDGLYLDSGAGFNSYANFPNGALFGEVNYETSTTFGSGGADVAHSIYLLNNLSNNYENFLYDTYCGRLFLNTYFNNFYDSYFNFNKLYNFNISDNGNKGILSLGNFSRGVDIYHNESFHVFFINQAASGNNGSMYFPYIAYTDTILTAMPIFTISSLYHSIDFKLLGSPFSSLWNIMVNGTTYQADSSNIYLNMTNGYYNIIVNLPAGYSAITKGVLYVNGTNQVYKIFVSYNNNSGISNDIIYAIILASIIVAAAIYFSKRS